MRQQRHDVILRQDEHPLRSYAQPYPLGSATSPAGAMAGPGDANVARAIFRHMWLVVIFTLLGVGGAALYLKLATPLYRSTAKIYIEPSGPRVLSESISPIQRASYLETQSTVIRSAPVLNLVAEVPGIRELRTFEICDQNPVLYLREYLETEVGRKDDIISIQIDTPHREDAARIVNAVVEAYTTYSNTEKRTVSSDYLKALLEAKQREDAELRRLTDQLFAFQRAHPDLALDGITNLALTQIQHAYVQAELAAIDAQGQYAPNHPRRLAADRQVKELRVRYEDAMGRSTGLTALALEHQRLESELLTKRELARGLDQKIRDVELQKDAEQKFNTVTVVESAIEPLRPSYPRPYRTYALALVAGVVVGSGLALLRDRMDGRMRSVEEIQTFIGLPVLGVVPAMSGRRTAIARAMTVHLDPRSVVAEAFRSIRTAVYFGAGSSACKTILITSPEAGDGKTTSASNLAIAMAQTGRTVLLLDADFRKPTQHKNLEVNDSLGLSTVLAGREPLSRVLQHTGVEGLDILPCGPIPANPSEILNSREFGELVDTLSEKYDHIVFDSPPVNAVTDARILGAVCDATILIVRADKSTRKAGEHARNALMGVGARLLGVIVNDAPRRKGYEVYGGSYYGQADIAVRSHDGYEGGNPRPRLPNAATDVAK